MNFQIELQKFNDLYYLLHIDKIVGKNKKAKNEVLNLFHFLKEEIKINHKDNEIINLDINYNYDSIGIKFPYNYLEHLFSEKPLFESIIYIDNKFNGYDLNKIFSSEFENIINIKNKIDLFEKIEILEKIFNIQIKDKILNNKIYNKPKRIENELYLIQYSSKSIFIIDKINDVQIVFNLNENCKQIYITSPYLVSEYYLNDINNEFIFEKIFSIYSSIFNTEVNFNNISDYLNLSRVFNY